MLKGNKNRFTKAKGGHPYDEPTFLSFFLIFDWTGSGSPLFNGKAAAFLRDVYGDEARAKKLEQFVKYLKKINLEMPWFWQSITGLESAHTYGALKDPYGYADAKIEIDCLDTLDFTISGIFDLYRSCVIDTNRYVEVLPGNLRKFTVYVHVQEIRNFVPFIGADRDAKEIKKLKGLDGADRNDAFASVNGGSSLDGYKSIQDRLNSDQLDWKAKGMGPRFVTRLDNCKFDWDNGSKMFSEISNVDISAPVKHKMCFYYQGASISEVEYLNAFNYKDSDPLSTFDNDMISDLNDSALKKLLNNIGVEVPSAAEIGQVLKKQLGSTFDGIVNRALQDAKGNLLLGNIYGANTLSKIQDIFNAGSINAIRPLVSGEDQRIIGNGAGGAVGDNLFPQASPESTLKSTNIYPQRSSENDANLGNVR